MSDDMRVKRGRKKLPPSERKQMYSFRIDPDLRKQLFRVSKGTRRPMSYLIEIALKEFLKQIKIKE